MEMNVSEESAGLVPLAPASDSKGLSPDRGPNICADARMRSSAASTLRRKRQETVAGTVPRMTQRPMEALDTMKNVEAGSDATPADWTVREGMDVISTDGEKLGEVANATGNYVLVRHGFLFAKEYYVPAEAIANVGNDAVYLTMTREIALEQQWDNPPTADADLSAAPHVVAGDYEAVAAATSEPATGTFVDPGAHAGETFVDGASGTYTDERAGVQAIEQGDEEPTMNDAEITSDAHEELAAEIGIPVPDDEKLIDPLPDNEPDDEPDDADEPVPGDANPDSANSDSITVDERDLVVDDDGPIEAERNDQM